MLKYNAMNFTTKLFIEHLPTEMDVNEIDQRFSIVGSINYVFLVKDKLGKPTGKAIVEYQMEDSVNEAVKKFDDKPVDDLICRVKPYFTEKSQKRNQQGEL